jgi:hypothetical protein
MSLSACLPACAHRLPPLALSVSSEDRQRQGCSAVQCSSAVQRSR